MSNPYQVLFEFWILFLQHVEIFFLLLFLSLFILFIVGVFLAFWTMIFVVLPLGSFALLVCELKYPQWYKERIKI